MLDCLSELDKSYDIGASHGEGAAQDKSYGIGNDFENDNPPRVRDFDTSLLSFLGVAEDLLDLFFGNFNFHDKYAFVSVAKIQPKQAYLTELSKILLESADSQRYRIAIYIIRA